MILAFGLGFLHALDADHILTVSSLMSSGRGHYVKRSVQFCSHWAIGHGFSIIVVGSAVIFIGVAIPHQMSQVAERVVGIMLIILGAWTSYKLYVQFSNTAWKEEEPQRYNRTTHGATLIGCMHGLAGSAPVLALIPLSQSQSPWQSLAYLLIFALAVLIAMVAFGSLFSHSLKYIGLRNELALNILRACICGACITIGFYLALA